ncbi:hypothetical protein D1AOALGA4SA_3018 [Olavius algarvensis Delta 1 endosymbiont]|nr:hypothetical protein D1AOALGA4SA_3018 [Olavius algarvensis Delta 1 endosymbiont]
MADDLIYMKLFQISLPSNKKVLFNKIFIRPARIARPGFVLKDRTICRVGNLQFGTV